MNAERWERIEGLFFDALERDAAERAAFLHEACANDAALRDEVEAMLAAHEHNQSLLLEQRFLADEPVSVPGPDALLGTHIGAYQLKAVIGQGGMGTVYLAERTDGGFQQQVALKLVRYGMDREDVLLRFLNERQILAQLQHPNIARLLDGGVTEDGQPYFAMEYVEGEPIDAYCDTRRLAVEERLALFAAAAEAVQYAHQNLVVHRDLKPSNLLVTEEGEVRLLDFGIAKLTEDSDEAPALTRTGMRVMTPEYASPEQVRGEPVTTMSDVYQLGILLYELLAGRRPYKLELLTPGAIERVICETEPEKPSTAVSRIDETGATPEEISQQRATHTERLQRRLTGDLDTICLKALQKESGRRYASAEAFVDDIKRLLAGLPVKARPDTLGYRARTFVRRHRVGVAAAALVVLSLIGGLAIALWQARVAAVERDRAQLEAETNAQVTDFLIGLFEAPDPGQALGDTLTAYDLLERGREHAEDELADQPLIQATMLNTLGRTYSAMGRIDLAEPLLQKALSERQRLLGASHEDVAANLYDIALLLKAKGAPQEAESAIREALTIQREHYGEEHPAVVASLSSLATLYHDQGRYEAADSLYRAVLTIRRQQLGGTHPDVAASLSNLAVLRYHQSNLDAAEALMREALQIRQDAFGTVHPEVVSSLNNLAGILRLKGDLEATEPLLREVLDVTRALYGETHPRVAVSLNNLAMLEKQQGNFDDAVQLYRQAVDMQRQLMGADHPEVATYLNNLARLLKDQEKYEAAEPLYREALSIWQNSYDEHPRVAMGLNNLGTLLSEQRRYEEAEPLLRESLAMNRALLGDRHPRVAFTLDNLGELLVKQEQYAAAEPLYREAVTILEAAQGPDHGDTKRLRAHLAALYAAWGRPSELDTLRVEPGDALSER